MAFCMECGTELPDGAKFCFLCGTPVGKLKKDLPKMEVPHDILKCPNCSSNISSISIVCPFCGAEVASKEAPYSIKEFSRKMAELVEKEDVRKPTHQSKSLFEDRTYYSNYDEENLERKTSLIYSFPIPSSVEELTEFMIMASNSFDVKYGKNTFWNRHTAKGAPAYDQIAMANAWISKMEQIYEKAKIQFPGDPMFKKIEEIYTKKMKEMGRL